MLGELNQVYSVSRDGASPPYPQTMLDDEQMKTRAMVPMLDWPTDLFNTFAVQFDDASEYQRA